MGRVGECRNPDMFSKCFSEDYDNSYDFFLHINENRKDIITAINRLGELLVFYDVEGDVEDWAIHVEKVCTCIYMYLSK